MWTESFPFPAVGPAIVLYNGLILGGTNIFLPEGNAGSKNRPLRQRCPVERRKKLPGIGGQ